MASNETAELIRSLSAFDPSHLSGQFILSKKVSRTPPSWSSHQCGDWHLSSEASLPVAPILSPSGDIVGWLLGDAIDIDQRTSVDQLQLHKDPATGEGIARFQSLLYSFLGRYIAILAVPGRLYLDPIGLLSAVFQSSTETAASTITLLRSDNAGDYRQDLIGILNIPQNNGLYPFGLTPMRSVERLLPNHYLDLNTWQAIRHWHPGSVDRETALADALDEISDLLSKTMLSILTLGKPWMSLTAGKDSRVLLAHCKGMTDRVDFFTWALPDKTARRDVMAACQIAGDLSLSHTIFPFDAPVGNDSDEWVYRTGCSVGEQRGRSLATTIKRMPHHEFYVPGLASEIGRGFYWDMFDRHSDDVSADVLLTKLRLPASDDLRQFGEQWMRPLKDCSYFDILDLLYVEQRLGCWAGVVAYGECVGGTRIVPFSHRRIVDLLFSLPVSFKKKDRLATELIRRTWPGLLRYKFNPEPLPRAVYRRLRHTVGGIVRKNFIRR